MHLESEIAAMKASSHDEELMETIRALNAKLKEEKENSKVYGERIHLLNETIQDLENQVASKQSEGNSVQEDVLTIENELVKKDMENLKEVPFSSFKFLSLATSTSAK